ncbi:MAG: 4-(cytidine 5'-diphospho)-2-C-methyl-D-erythritol kinase [Dysgonamonadaceae bacterium]|nr:4-(cytidine 5'-diphospho)-2-C-methyl-D-erythritol kinase [Dysgonamonadaceae bacterium]
MICFPNAKINLGLNIISKREDGYHNLETLFYPVNLNDVLEIVPAQDQKNVFVQYGTPISGNPSDNLVMKAYRLLQSRYEVPEVAVYLRKNIPLGAGLGGGSSDAAFMLKILNEFAGLGIDNRRLEALASLLGADCPFFIENRPVFAEGIGDKFTTVDLSLKAYHLLMVKPDIAISTKEAYAGVQPQKPRRSILEIIVKPIDEWKGQLVNDFEQNVFVRHPEIGMIKQQLYDAGALYASMSGSGSAVFGIFESQPAVTPLFKRLSQTLSGFHLYNPTFPM